jgi:hypothetical protein
MATKGQTHAKRDRERELREKRERKRAKKAEAAALRAAGIAPAVGGDSTAPGADGPIEPAVPEWIQ